MKITASIVLYENEIDELKKPIRSFLNTTLDAFLFLIDNSPNDRLKILANDTRICYLHNPTNIGFGAAHNMGFEKAIRMDSQYHFVINPDIYFQDPVVEMMIAYMKDDPSIGLMMPQVLYTDGTIQFSPKLLPSPIDIVWRKISKPQKLYEKFIDQYELRSMPNNKIYNLPVLSGCFSLFNMEAIKKIGFYDDSFFMYFEDWDLSRRIHRQYKTLYFPLVSVFHGYERGPAKNLKLVKIYLRSAVRFFNKWGWFFDSERKKINQKALAQFK